MDDVGNLAGDRETGRERKASGVGQGQDGGDYVLDVDHLPFINYAMQQNDVPFIRGICLRNISASASGLVLRLSADMGAMAEETMRIDPCPMGERVNVPAARCQPQFVASDLVNLEERRRASLTAELSSEDGTVLLHEASRFDVLAYNQWPGVGHVPEILAAFVMANHPALGAPLREAADLLLDQTEDASLAAYQRVDVSRARSEIGALYQAVADMGIAYVNPPASFEQTGQKILTPEQVCADRVGTCMDLSVFLASLLERAGLAPLIMLKEGHAFVGAWLRDDSFETPVVRSSLALKKRVDLGEIILLEATGLTATPPLAFPLAVRGALRHLDTPSEFHMALDIRMARQAGIRPMAARRLADTFEPAPSVAPGHYGPAAEGGQELSSTSEGHGANQVSRVAEEAIPARPSPVTRIERWKNKLLDLTRRNRLLNFKDSRKALPLLCHDPAAIEDSLTDGGQFSVLSRPQVMDPANPRDHDLHLQHTGEDAVETFLRGQMQQGRLHSPLGEKEVGKRLMTISRADRLSMEETGANTLFLALGFLHWCDLGSSTPMNAAPVILVPMQLERRSARKGFRISLLDEESRINVTLLQKLKVDFDIDIPGLDPLPTDGSGLDVAGILRTLREAIKHMDRWDIVDDACLAILTFTKFLMWLDLENRTDLLKRNEICRHLLETPGEPFPDSAQFVSVGDLDSEVDPADTYCPLDADSSQLRAILAADQGRSFVLQGPPGTGKSQTIANLIAHCTAKGKRVLFVSEKMAALQVVQRRLEASGVGPFCLEVHSRKANKHEFRAQLEAAMSASVAGPDGSWKSEGAQLRGLRDQLNSVAGALHRPRSFGRSAHWAINALIRHTALPEINGDFGAVEPSPEHMDLILAAALELQGRAESSRLTPQHALLGLCPGEWYLGMAADVRRACADLVAAAKRLASAAPPALKPLRLGSSNWSRYVLDFGCVLGGLLREAPETPEALLRTPDWVNINARLASLVELLRDRAAAREELFAVYTEEVLELPVSKLRRRLKGSKARALPLRWVVQFLIRRSMRTVLRDPQARRIPEIEHDLALAARLSRLTAEIGAFDDLGDSLGAYWRGGEGDGEAIEKLRTFVERFRDTVSGLPCADPRQAMEVRDLWIGYVTAHRDMVAPDGPLGVALRELDEAYTGFVGRWREAGEILGFRAEPDTSETGDPGHLNTVTARCQRWSEHAEDFRSWCLYVSAREAALDLGLNALVAAVEEGDVRPEDIPAAAESSLARWYLATLFREDNVLKSFFGPDHNRAVRRFCELEEAHTDHTRGAVVRRLADRMPAHSDENGRYRSSEVGRLKRVARGGRFTIRGVFRDCPNALAKAKPCVLMSPLSVAQFLSADFPLFDIVVFDEASQMPPWDAIGAVARGRQLIVVGDSKQLPPTSFFERTSEGDMDELTEEDLEDMESILDECIACQLPTLPLLWHYRSRHESLIAFSNDRYYHSGLSTFPSAASRVPNLGVSWHHVPEGHYDASRTRTNQAEAESVVAEVVRRLSDPEEHSWSIGIVTFSMAQQGLIEDLLESARLDCPSIDPYFTDNVDEPVFVKNLETVQGDERDVMLFSICYAPRQDGGFSHNLGPLNKRGGERRLNVAVTRARRQLLVFSTLRADQIDLGRTKATGVRHLKEFLGFAQRQDQVPESVPIAMGGPAFGSALEASVHEALVQRGWQVDAQVGCSGYRIDLAVRHPEADGHYVIGIECDGPNYRSGATATDRDRLRHAVLRRLGWRMTRVWSTDWWLHRSRALGDLLERIADAISDWRDDGSAEELACNAIVRQDIEDESGQHDGAFAATQAAVRKPGCSLSESDRECEPSDRQLSDGAQVADRLSTAGVASSSSSRREGEIPYEEAQLEMVPGTDPGVKFYEGNHNRSIRARIRQTVDAEGPVHPDVLTRRIIACWGLKRVTRKARNRIYDLVDYNEVQVTETDSGRQFVWTAEQQPSTYSIFRVPPKDGTTPRTAEQICPEEAANAMQAVLREHLSMTREDLLRAAAEVFGISRLGRQVRASMEEGLALLSATQRCVVDGETVSVP